MQWLLTRDVELFRLINSKLINPVFDVLMPIASGNAWFFPLLLLGAVLLLWKGHARGRVCVAMLVVILPLGDGLVCNTLKHAIGRPRPFDTLADVRRPDVQTPPVDAGGPSRPADGQVNSALHSTSHSANSMPSSHAANWFAATMIAFVYYRRSGWFMLPAAALVSYSRIYNGVHYPSDVLAGAILGAGYAAASLWLMNAFWIWAGSKWFPLWWEKMPVLMNPVIKDTMEEDEEAAVPPRGLPAGALPSAHSILDSQWLRLGYVFVGVLLLFRLWYISSDVIQLTKDEAYYWLWAKHPLALSYYSKPPMIAYTEFLGTRLWGDTAFGVRFFSPICAAIMSVALLRFFAREVNARAGFFLVLIVTATPLASLGAVLMTIDPLSVLFWTAAMLAGWHAVQDDSGTRYWLWTGLWMGLGFLSKYTQLFQLLCWAVFFALWPPARKHLRRPGPWLALLINALCALPVLWWNHEHGWITVQHVENDAGVGSTWRFAAGEFLGVEAALLNPIFFVAVVWASIAFWHRNRHNPRLVYFFSMGAPLFLAYFLWSFKSRVLPNWIAPAVLPLFCLMVIYWDTRWRLGLAKIKGWLIAGLGLGFAAIILAHDTDLIGRLTGGRFLPVNIDPLHRARGWTEVARDVGDARRELLKEGKPVFVVTDDYQQAGILSFYIPEAREGLPDNPLVYFRNNPVPKNQFYFWPGYNQRVGESALFVMELDRHNPAPRPPPPQMEREFESVTDMGVHSVLYHGRLCWPIQIFACRGLKPVAER